MMTKFVECLIEFDKRPEIDGVDNPPAAAVYWGIVAPQVVNDPTVRGLMTACAATGATVSLTPVGSRRHPEGTHPSALTVSVAEDRYKQLLSKLVDQSGRPIVPYTRSIRLAATPA